MTTNLFCSKCGSGGPITLYNNHYLCRTCWEYSKSQPPIVTTNLINTIYAGSQGQNCYKCKKPFDNINPAIPASGCSSSTFVHGSCSRGCTDGGPHQWQAVIGKGWLGNSHILYERCIVCGETRPN